MVITPLRWFLATARVAFALWIFSATFSAQGQISISAVRLPDGRVQLSWPDAVGGQQLETTDAVNRPWTSSGLSIRIAGGQRLVELTPADSARFFRLKAGLSVPPLTIASASPAQKETGVAVTRETIFRLSAPLAADTTLGVNQVSAFAAGRKLLSRVELSSDRKTVTLFPLENLPADARIEVSFDGTGLFDGSNRPIDPDGDGVLGGVAHLTYQTLSTTALATTGVEGHVFASEKDAAGGNRPLRNVTITVDGMEETLRTTTDTNGFFRLVPSPAGRFFVSVDGRTAEGSEWPGGAYYPFVGKAWDAVPGRTNNLAGGSGIIYLPLIQADALKTISSTADTKITFAASVLATNAALAGVEIDVPANALFSDNGTRGGKVGIAPVPFDRLPEPLPLGLNLPLVITIQTDGARNFDQPVPIKFPNLPDPVTGVKLPPGAKTALWSFNHDTGRWEIQGPATVTADGNFVVSDPGVGVRQPGWHGTAPGGSGGGPGNCPPFCKPDPQPEGKDKCDEKAAGTYLSIHDLALDTLFAAGDSGGSWLKGCALGAGISFTRAVRDCLVLSDEGCRGSMKANYIGTALGCVPKIGTILSLGWGAKGLIDASFDWYDCEQNKQGRSRGSDLTAAAVPIQGSGLPPELARAIAFLNQQVGLAKAASNLVSVLYGAPELFAPASPQDSPAYTNFFSQLAAAVAPQSPGGATVTAAERNALLALPKPNGASNSALTAAINRVEQVANDGIFSDGSLRAQVVAALDNYLSVADPLLAAGWDGNFYGLERAIEELSSLAGSGALDRPPGGSAAASPGLQAFSAPAPGQTLTSDFPETDLFFRLLNLENGFEQRGRLNPQGKFNNLILAPNTPYQISYADPSTLKLGVAWFKSGGAGLVTEVPAALMLEHRGPDADQDGLDDIFELVLGTNRLLADSDGDGINDGVELASGTNPSDGQPLGLGVVATRDTQRSATQIDTVNDTALVADAQGGIAVFNVANPLAPVLLSQFTPGGATYNGVSVAGEWVAAVPGTTLLSAAGVHVLRLGSDGTLSPQATIATGMNSDSVIAAGRYAYVAGKSANALTIAVIHLKSGLLLHHVPVPNGTAITRMVLDGDTLWLISNGRLYSYRISGDDLLLLSQTPISGFQNSSVEELMVAKNRIYIGGSRGLQIWNGSDPATPTMLFAPAANQALVRHLALNGSGLLVAVTSFNSSSSRAVSLYDVRADTATNFLASFITPGSAAALSMHRGYVLAADQAVGLSVVNILAPDRGTNPPSVTLQTFTSQPDGQEADEAFYVRPLTTDDVQVRDVEFFIDGASAGRSGKFPFAITLTAPSRLSGKTNFVLRAKATDTGGNSAWSAEVTLKLLPDVTPPRLIAVSPAPDSVQPRGSLSMLSGIFDSAVTLGSLKSGWTLTWAGADGNFGTTDDLNITSGGITFVAEERTGYLRFAAPLPSGKYRARIADTVVDAAGNPLSGARSWDFSIPIPVPVESLPAHGSVWLTDTLRRFEIRFDERLMPGSVTPDSLQVLATNGANSVILSGGGASLSADGRGAVLELPQSLANGGYRVVLTPAIKDVYGSPVQTNFPIALLVKGPSIWARDGSGVWSGATNWSGNLVPISGDHVIIDRPAANPTITLRSAANVTTLQVEEPFVLEGGSLTVRDSAVFNAPFTWTGPGIFGGVIELRGGGSTTGGLFDRNVVRNSGVFEWQHGGFTPRNLATFHNLAGGTFLINKDDTSGFVGINGGLFRNEGTMRKNGGMDFTFFTDLVLLNSGLLDVMTGTLELSTTTTNAGAIQVAAGAQVYLGTSTGTAPRGGTFNQLPSGRITGQGQLVFGGRPIAVAGTVDFDGVAYILEGSSFKSTAEFRAGTLDIRRAFFGTLDCSFDNGGVVGAGGLTLARDIDGSGTLRVEGPTGISRGSLGGQLVLRPEGGFGLTNSFVVQEFSRLINTAASHLDTNTALVVEDQALFQNDVGGTLDLGGNGRLQSSRFTTNHTALLLNLGLIRKSISTNIASTLGYFQNDGRVAVDAGTLRIESTGVHQGRFEIAAGATLNIFDQLNDFASESEFSGAGDLLFTSRTVAPKPPALVGILRGKVAPARMILQRATVRVVPGVTLPPTEVTLGGTIEVAGEVMLTAPFNMDVGQFTAQQGVTNATVRNAGQMQLVGPASITSNVKLVNAPGGQISGLREFSISSGGLLHNQAGATYIGGGTNTSNPVSTPRGAFWNEGTFSGAYSNLVENGLMITNTGLFQVEGGPLRLRGLFLQLAGEFRLNGQIELDTGFFPNDKAPLQLFGGTLSGSGSILYTNDNVRFITNHASVIMPGLPLGILTMGEDFAQEAGGTLEIELAGRTPRTQHDQLIIPGLARFAGTLRLQLRDGFVPALGDEFVILTFRSRSSTTFTTVEGQAIGGGKRLDVIYESSRILVRCVASP